MNVGQNLRTLRKEKKITLKELSQQTGVDTATLSRIERNLMTGTVESHIRICQTLGISIAQLYSQLETNEKPVDVVQKSSHAELFVPTDKNKFNYEMLTTNVLQKKMMPLLIKLDKDGATQLEQTPGGTEKFYYCTGGEIEINLGDKKYQLKEGDALYFDGSIPHFLKNISNKESHCICVITPPFL